ncbi:MAG: flippase-like domain-containing protein [Pirellulales bacterium]|nr:flippase-like domain-containing protein [Pirellulales bacterium]
MKKFLITFLKIAVPLAIVAYLIWNSTRGGDRANAFANLKSQPKNWWFFAAAWAVATAAVLLTFVRWWFLVRALEIPCRFRDALRISFWGYLFNLAPLGIVGGDLVKVVMLAYEQPRHRAKAAASVVVDRVIGLYLLFIVATVAIFLSGFWQIPDAGIHFICRATLGLTAVGTLGIAVLLLPGATDGKLTRALGRLPRIGRPVASLIDAVRMYRRKPRALFLTSLMTVGVHCLFAFSVYLIARGLPGEVLSLGKHFVIMPLSSATAVIPFAMGPLEFMLDFLYANVPAAAGAVIPQGQGLVVALCYRLITVFIAALGAYYYLGNRKEVAEAMHESDGESTAPPPSNAVLAAAWSPHALTPRSGRQPKVEWKR